MPHSDPRLRASGVRRRGLPSEAARESPPHPVMMLVAGSLRVALLTAHLPLHAVPAAITGDALSVTLKILAADLRRRFGLARPRILVCGPNPPAGASRPPARQELDTLEPPLRPPSPPPTP